MAGKYELDDAAAAALWRLERASPNEEQIGLLYGLGDKVQATPTVGQSNASKVKGAFTIPRGSLKAIFHNHPGRSNKKSGRSVQRRDSQRQEFSEDDVNMAVQKGVPSYIIADGKVRRYTPGKNPRGEDVLAQIPIAEIKSQFARRIQDSRMSHEMKRRLLAKLMTPEET